MKVLDYTISKFPSVLNSLLQCTPNEMVLIVWSLDGVTRISFDVTLCQQNAWIASMKDAMEMLLSIMQVHASESPWVVFVWTPGGSPEAASCELPGNQQWDGEQTARAIPR